MPVQQPSLRHQVNCALESGILDLATLETKFPKVTYNTLRDYLNQYKKKHNIITPHAKGRKAGRPNTPKPKKNSYYDIIKKAGFLNLAEVESATKKHLKNQSAN